MEPILPLTKDAPRTHIPEAGGVPNTILFDTHISPLSKEGYTAQATVPKPVSESLFQYLSVSLSFGTVSEYGGDGSVFRAILACPYPLEAHLSRAIGE